MKIYFSPLPLQQFVFPPYNVSRVLSQLLLMLLRQADLRPLLDLTHLYSVLVAVLSVQDKLQRQRIDFVFRVYFLFTSRLYNLFFSLSFLL